MTASKKAVRTRRGVEPAGRPARREVERGRRARTNSSRTFARRATGDSRLENDDASNARRRCVFVGSPPRAARGGRGRRRRARSEFSGARARARALSQRPRAARCAGSRGAGGRLTSAKAPPARDVTTLIQWSSAWPANACAGAVRRRRGRARSRAGRRGENPGRAGQTRRRTSVRMSAMPQARPSLLGPRSTRKVQPVQSSRASFLWLFSSVAMVLCAALAP